MLKMTAYLKETVSQSRLSTQIWEKIQGTVVFLSVSYIKKKSVSTIWVIIVTVF